MNASLQKLPFQSTLRDKTNCALRIKIQPEPRHEPKPANRTIKIILKINIPNKNVLRLYIFHQASFFGSIFYFFPILLREKRNKRIKEMPKFGSNKNKKIPLYSEKASTGLCGF
jgi:hypothetical protein